MSFLFRLFLLACGPATLFAAPPPKLAVVISVDQLRADYLQRFGPYFGAGGFRRLTTGGLVFEECHYAHALTQTAPGHATILTGAYPMTHGIIANEWLDRDLWEQVNNVEDRTAPLVGLTPADATAALLAPKAGRSPRTLRADTVGDQLKLRHGAKAKVFAASNKDRSAMLLAGRLADAAYWDENGVMVTSRYYREQVPAWVAAFNAERRVHASFGKVWERLLEPAVYDAVQGPDDAPGEWAESGFTRTFPKKVTGGRDAVGPAFFTAFDNSPFSTEFLGEFVQRAIVEEKLGRNGATDLLCVSFSQVDTVGHNYGPDSHEVMDAMLRLDRVLAGIFDRLDREVGLANCVIVLSADHGVAPLPERVNAGRTDGPGGRFKVAELDAAGRKALDAAFGAPEAPEYWFTRDNNGFHLRAPVLAAKKLNRSEVAAVLRNAVAALPFVAQAYTRDQILAASPDGPSVLAAVRRGYFPERDRDVVMVYQPYFQSRVATGTSHGTPYGYDTHVPQVWFGAGVPAGVRKDRVGVEDIAPTLSALLGVPAPVQAQGVRRF